jgi:hypothetical protein
MKHMGTHIYITLALLFFFSFTLLPLFLVGRLAQTLPVWHTTFQHSWFSTELVKISVILAKINKSGLNV